MRVDLFKPMLYIPFRSGRNGRKISYRHAHRYEAPHVPPRPKFWPVSTSICNPAEILFWLFIYFFSLFLLLSSFFFFFFFLLLLSSAQLSLCLCTFSLPFFFLFFGSSAVIAVKSEMKKKKKTEEMDRLQWP